jgi:hypothetical protein
MKIWNGTYGVMYVGTDVDRVMYVEVDVLNARRRLVVLLFEKFYHSVARSYRKYEKIGFKDIPIHPSLCIFWKFHPCIFILKGPYGAQNPCPIFSLFGLSWLQSLCKKCP